MKLEGRRESTNVEDRRGKRTAAAAGGIGLGGIIIYLIISLMGGDASAVMEQMQQQGSSTEYVDDGQDYSQVDVEIFSECAGDIVAGKICGNDFHFFVSGILRLFRPEEQYADERDDGNNKDSATKRLRHGALLGIRRNNLE